MYQADFDRLALLSDESWDHNRHYQPFLLRQLPPRCDAILEIGCGTGGFARLLAPRAERVVGLDLSPQMIRLARERSAAYPNLEFHVADALTWPYPPAAFDAVVSIATLHHLPFAGIVARLKPALKPGGLLLVLDLVQGATLTDRLLNLMACLAGVALSLVKTGRLRPPAAIRAAWAEHGRHESYLTLAQVRQACVTLLPGAAIRRHLFWRYSIVWRKETPDSPVRS